MLDVVILFFLLGLAAGLARSDLRLPAALYESLSLFLLLAIGLKGGEGLARQALGPLLPQLLAVVLLGVLIALLAYAILRPLGRLARADAAATAAHYGSVSVATFAVGVDWLAAREIAFEAQASVFLAVMEVPAIVVGILLARGAGRASGWGVALHEAFLGKGVALLLGGMLVGWIAGPEGLAPIKDFYHGLFKGVLTLFLLEMGLIVSRQLPGLRRHGPFLVAFGVLFPLASAALGLACGWLLGLSVGGLTLLATLAASASYIAAPAAMRVAVPQADPGLSLGVVLGVTFPFNILVGIGLYHACASWLVGAAG